MTISQIIIQTLQTLPNHRENQACNHQQNMFCIQLRYKLSVLKKQTLHKKCHL